MYNDVTIGAGDNLPDINRVQERCFKPKLGAVITLLVIAAIATLVVTLMILAKHNIPLGGLNSVVKNVATEWLYGGVAVGGISTLLLALLLRKIIHDKKQPLDTKNDESSEGSFGVNQPVKPIEGEKGLEEFIKGEFDGSLHGKGYWHYDPCTPEWTYYYAVAHKKEDNGPITYVYFSTREKREEYIEVHCKGLSDPQAKPRAEQGFKRETENQEINLGAKQFWPYEFQYEWHTCYGVAYKDDKMSKVAIEYFYSKDEFKDVLTKRWSQTEGWTVAKAVPKQSK